MKMDKKYIPTVLEFAKLYSDWADKMARSFYSYGSLASARDAVSDAFLKVMGISEKFHLKAPLQPMTTGAWYVCIRNQAEWILRHGVEKLSRFISYDETPDFDLESSAITETLPDENLDLVQTKKAVRAFVDRACRKHGISSRNRNAFIKLVLDEMDTDEVIESTWGPSATDKELAAKKNNLYVLRHRIMNTLRQEAKTDKALECYRYAA